jgi:hypothetical protein
LAVADGAAHQGSASASVDLTRVPYGARPPSAQDVRAGSQMTLLFRDVVKEPSQPGSYRRSRASAPRRRRIRDSRSPASAQFCSNPSSGISTPRVSTPIRRSSSSSEGSPRRKPAPTARRCSVIEECLDYALTNHEEFGIFGGTTPHERQQLRRRGVFSLHTHLNVVNGDTQPLFSPDYSDCFARL